MNKLLLLPMILCLLLGSCREVNDDTDFPLPQKPVSEMIQGKWLSSSGITYYFNDGDPDPIDNRGIFFAPYTDHIEASIYGDYTLSENANKPYIELTDYSTGTRRSRYNISAISDSKMIWEKESGLGLATIEFIKEETNIDPDKPVSELLQGEWYLIYTIPDLYPNTPFMYPNTYNFYNVNYLNIYNEAYGGDSDIQYILNVRNGSTYIDYTEYNTPEETNDTYTFEIVAISDEKMTLKNLYDNSDTNRSQLMELIRK
jgi:hypothetical protein